MVHLVTAVISAPVQTPDAPVSFLAAAIPAPAHIMVVIVVAPAALTAEAAVIPAADVHSAEEAAAAVVVVAVPAITRAAQVDEGINAEILTPPNRKS